jgi:hypothetical protein
MSIKSRLDRIEKQVAVYAGDDIPDELRELRRSMFEPTWEEERAAIIEVGQTMPEEFQNLFVEDVMRFLDSPCETEFRCAFTERVFELSRLRLYGCPKPLALPGEFCRTYLECPPDHEIEFVGHECRVCVFQHPVETWYEGRQPRGRVLFTTCLLCGGPVSYNAYAQATGTSAQCHEDPGSPYRRAMSGRLADEAGRF